MRKFYAEIFFFKFLFSNFFKNLFKFCPSMLYSKIDYSVAPIKEYRAFISKKPTTTEPIPQVFASTIFAKNVCLARASIEKLLKNQYKIKPDDAVVLEIKEIEQERDFVFRNYGIKFTYKTKSSLQNGYKEIRNMNRVLAVSDLYQEFGAGNKIKSCFINIIEVNELPDDKVTKTRVLSYLGDNVMFPIFYKVPNTEQDCVPASIDLFN